MNYLKSFVCAAAVVLVQSGAAVADDAADVAAAIQKWQDLFNAGDATVAVQAVFADDARLLPPDSDPVEGHDAITAFWQGVIDAPPHSLKLGLVDLQVDGTTAIESGTWQITVPLENGREIQVGGNTLVVWVKQADGEWRMVRDMWSNASKE